MTGVEGRKPGPTVRLTAGWQESHLLPDAVVAFVDGELTLGATERAAMHMTRCTSCAADVAAQRQVRAAVHDSHTPSVPATLLASLHSIPDTTELSTMPDNLAVDEHGQVVAVQRPDRASGTLGSGPALGSSEPLGSASFLGRLPGRRTSAGVVMSGLVAGAIALAMGFDEGSDDAPSDPPGARPGAELAPAQTPQSFVRLGVNQP